MGPGIVLALGLAAGALPNRRRASLPVRVLGAALLVSLVWVVGVYLLLALTAVGELGPPLPGPLLLTFLPALGGATLGALLRGDGAADAAR